jgi:hypothetical protein
MSRLRKDGQPWGKTGRKVSPFRTAIIETFGFRTSDFNSRKIGRLAQQLRQCKTNSARRLLLGVGRPFRPNDVLPEREYGVSDWRQFLEAE